MTEYNKRTLKNVLEDYCEEHENELLKEIEEAKNDPRYMVKEGEAEAFVKAHSKKRKSSRAKKFIATAASLFLVFTVLTTAISFKVQGDKHPFYDFIIEVHRNFIVMHNPQITDELDGYEGSYIPKWRPLGYSVHNIEKNRYTYTITFHDKYDYYNVSYIETPKSKSFEYGLSPNESYKEIKINDYQGLYFENKVKRQINFFIGDTMISVATDDPDLDLVYFAEQVQKK